jgi:hypothetical protein
LRGPRPRRLPAPDDLLSAMIVSRDWFILDDMVD